MSKMRLLDSRTLTLKEFLPQEVPPYAILSHMWGREEVSFQEMQHSNEQIRNKTGYSKVERCCATAVDDGFDFVWIDTCCIDKSSSSELSEAINSMFKWYKQADVCYAFVSDVPSGLVDTALDSALRRSRWFTRGWTLQELIAPACVIFFDIDWQEFGTKSSLRDLIQEVTSIQVDALLGHNTKGFSIAQKMSWAASRTTTISEDIAYCLMGIFEVNMPLLYGEGEHAFMRLQEEIVKRSDDHSIFAWQVRPSSCMLASSPKCFQKSSNIVSARSFPTEPFTLTNKGLKIKLPLRRISEEEEPSMYFTSALVNGCPLPPKKEQLPHLRIPIIYAAILNCHRLDEPDNLICVYPEHMTTLSEAGTDEAIVLCLDLARLDLLEMRSIPLVDHGSFQARSFYRYVRSHSRQSIAPVYYARHLFFV